MKRTTQRRAVTVIEVLVCATSLLAVGCMLLPAMAATRNDFKLQVSLNNLRVLGTMHVAYANDWEGRQWTVTPDNLSEFVCTGYRETYPPKGATCNGHDWSEIPSVPLGFDCKGEFWETRRGWAVQQMWYTGNCGVGTFRTWNTHPFNVYANGKVYDPLFWAPRDLDINTGADFIRSYFEQDCQWPGAGASFWYPSYCLSVAAQVDPEVFRGPQDGGSQRARNLQWGHRTPNLGNAAYPDLKTHMLEHYWLNNWPPNHDPYIPESGNTPWFYNMSDRSEPATLFFDGSVRVLPVLEVLASNDLVVTGGHDSLWANDPACFGNRGYFENYAQPPQDSATYEFVDMTASFHVFTRDGILGRDTVFSGP